MEEGDTSFYESWIEMGEIGTNSISESSYRLRTWRKAKVANRCFVSPLRLSVMCCSFITHHWEFIILLIFLGKFCGSIATKGKSSYSTKMKPVCLDSQRWPGCGFVVELSTKSLPMMTMQRSGHIRLQRFKAGKSIIESSQAFVRRALSDFFANFANVIPTVSWFW